MVQKPIKYIVLKFVAILIMANALRMFGGLDNSTYWNEQLSADPFCKGLMFQYINISPFVNNQWTHKMIPTMAYLASIGRFLAVSGETTRVAVNNVTSVMLAEVLAPCLPDNLFLNTQAAREMFVKSVLTLLAYDGLGRFTEASRQEYLDQVAIALSVEPVEPCILQSLDWHLEAPDPNAWGQVIPPHRAGISAHQAMHILAFLALKATPSGVRKGLDSIVHILVAVVKRGTVTTPFLDKIINGVMIDLNKTVALEEEVIRLLYRNFGRSINSINIRDVFGRWTGQIPVNALRLSLTVLQASGFQTCKTK